MNFYQAIFPQKIPEFHWLSCELIDHLSYSTEEKIISNQEVFMCHCGAKVLGLLGEL